MFSVNRSNARSGEAATRKATRTREPTLRTLDVRSERRQLLLPTALCFLEPGLELGHGLRAEAVNADAGVEFGMAFLDQAAGTQDFQVAAHGRRPQTELRRQLASSS